MTAAQYLAQMQRVSASTSPHNNGGGESDLPTPYQTTEDYKRLSRAKADIERALRRTPRFRIVENLVFGSRETSLLNAHCSYIPESKEYLIVFNRGLLMSISAVSHLIVHALDLSIDRGRRVAEYQINPGKIREFGAHFFHVLDSTGRGRALNQNVAEPFRPEEIDSKTTEQTLIEDAAFDFVFAHEYAHVVCGHLAESETIRTHEISEYGRWGFEYQADTEALDLLGTAWVERYHRNPFSAVYIARGVCLFFGVLRRLEQYRAWVLGDSSMVWTPAHSHPPTVMRWLRLITQFEQRVPGPGWSEFLQAQLWSIDECVKAYFDASVPTSEHPTHAISIEQDAQQRILSSAGMFYALPQELLIVLKVIRTKPFARTILSIEHTKGTFLTN